VADWAGRGASVPRPQGSCLAPQWHGSLHGARRRLRGLLYEHLRQTIVGPSLRPWAGSQRSVPGRV